jgi:molybdate transport system ATP-binding protein
MNATPASSTGLTALGLEVHLRANGAIPLSVDLVCAPGEMLALCGPSGSGKTSVLRAIAGLFPFRQLKGSVRLNGDVWFDSDKGKHLPPQQRRTGFVFQHYALLPHLTVLQNVVIGLTQVQTKTSQALEQAIALLTRLGLQGLENRYPKALSGGQQQRVALARALYNQPSVLLLDEPFSAVDTATRQELYRELAQLRDQFSCPIVLVTHDLQEARQLSNQVVVMDAGVTLQSGPPVKVFSRPRNARVAHIVGLNNLFTGRFFKGSASTASPEMAGGSTQATLAWTYNGKEIGLALDVPDKGKIDDGAEVHWLIAGEFLEIAPPDVTAGVVADAAALEHPGFSAPPLRPNTVAFEISHIAQLGEISLCTLACLAQPALKMAVTLATATLRNWHSRVGTTLQINFIEHGIHIMPVRAQLND